jgi:DNA polymerase I-like protein with 3'-5' exonuclease and polymerase domains
MTSGLSIPLNVGLNLSTTHTRLKNGKPLDSQEMQIRHLENCLDFNYIAVDSEGWRKGEIYTVNGKRYVSKGILGVSIALPTLHSMYFPLGHTFEDVNVSDEVLALLKEVLVSVQYRIFHNAPHDLYSMLDIADMRELQFLDTMILAHMVDENFYSKRLNDLHKYYCKGSGKDRDPMMQSIIDAVGWYMVPFELINRYGSVDSQITMELAQTLIPLYEEQFGPLWTP